MYRDVSLIVANLNNRCQLVGNLNNRCRADKMSKAMRLVVDHRMGSNVDKRLDDWLGR